VTPATGVVLWIYAEGSKWFVRRCPKHAVAKGLAWSECVFYSEHDDDAHTVALFAS
jgi:hypothetical protein